MPRYDRTGPRGEGRLTGGGFGLCRPEYGTNPMPRYARAQSSGFSGSMGRGNRRRGMQGFGPGMRGGRGYGQNVPQRPDIGSETEWLRDSAKGLESELASIQARLAEIERSKSGNSD